MLAAPRRGAALRLLLCQRKALRWLAAPAGLHGAAALRLPLWLRVAAGCRVALVLAIRQVALLLATLARQRCVALRLAVC